MARGTFYEEAFPPGTLPPADYETKELNNIIRSTVSRMPERMREIFLLNRDSGLPSAEITKKSQK
jgi:DNA-directed RNA polymerase specialized sigma24 family protein